MFPYTHASNMLFIDDAPYKTMFNNLYSVFFSSHFTAFVGKINVCWGLLSLTWKILICSDTMFPPLLNTIPWVGLDVLIKII
jgi:hypothetical protein